MTLDRLSSHSQRGFSPVTETAQPGPGTVLTVCLAADALFLREHFPQGFLKNLPWPYLSALKKNR